MTTFVVPPPEHVCIPVRGGAGVFPVRRIWCVGRNYRDHLVEMGHDPRSTPPVFFAKHRDAVVPRGGTVLFPPETRDFQPEVELVVAVGSHGFRLAPADADAMVYGYAVGLDMTRRDLTTASRQSGLPWELGKSFDQAAPCSDLVPRHETHLSGSTLLSLNVNGESRQCAPLSDMVWSVTELLSRLSQFVQLAPGDLVFTGTPAGVAPVSPGDRLHGKLGGIASLDVVIAGSSA